MSVESVAKALHVPGLTTIERVVLVGIANHDGDGGAWPSIATLAGYACCTPRHVQRTIAALSERGIVQVHKQAGGSASTPPDRRPNLYTIHWSVDNSDNGVTPRSPRSVRGDTQVASGVTPRSPEPSLEPSCITSETLFTREQVVKAAEKLRNDTPTKRQHIIDMRKAQRLTNMTPQPPIEAVALALLGEEASLIRWEHDQTQAQKVEPEPAALTRAERDALLENNRLTSGDEPVKMKP